MFEAFLAATFVALLSLSGIFFFGAHARPNKAGYALPFAVGVFLGIVFFELIPETIELSGKFGPIAIAIGFLGFYVLSHVLHTFHHHHDDEHDDCVGAGARMLLVGDAVHNFADGIVIASAFLLDPMVGIATTVGIALHEIPQEIAEFGVLLASGYTRKKAALYNLLSASSILLGVALTTIFVEIFPSWLFLLIGIAAGNLLYIAATDLLPELQALPQHHFWRTFFATLLGVMCIALLINLTHTYVTPNEQSLQTESGKYDS